MSVYGRLNYNFQPWYNDILILSDDVKDHLNTMPSMLKDWQINDIADSNVGGYFKNPVGNIANTLIITANILRAVTNISDGSVANSWRPGGDPEQNIPNEVQVLAVAANNFYKEIVLFGSHTNNVSGVNPIESGGDAAGDFPYFNTATGIGRFLIYLTHESDGILNSSPIIGCMTSLFVPDELSSNATIISTDLAIINASFTGSFYNLSSTQVNTIINHIETANNLVGTRRNHDVLFFRNAEKVLDDFNDVNIFSDMGETTTKLAKNYVGSDKLVQRITST